MNSSLEPYYPIPKPENEDKYKKYLELSKLYPSLILAGRLANYKYYTMSDTIKNALKIYKTESMKKSL